MATKKPVTKAELLIQRDKREKANHRLQKVLVLNRKTMAEQADRLEGVFLELNGCRTEIDTLRDQSDKAQRNVLHWQKQWKDENHLHGETLRQKDTFETQRNEARDERDKLAEQAERDTTQLLFNYQQLRVLEVLEEHVRTYHDVSRDVWAASTDAEKDHMRQEYYEHEPKQIKSLTKELSTAQKNLSIARDGLSRGYNDLFDARDSLRQARKELSTARDDIFNLTRDLKETTERGMKRGLIIAERDKEICSLKQTGQKDPWFRVSMNLRASKEENSRLQKKVSDLKQKLAAPYTQKHILDLYQKEIARLRGELIETTRVADTLTEKNRELESSGNFSLGGMRERIDSLTLENERLKTQQKIPINGCECEENNQLKKRADNNYRQWEEKTLENKLLKTQLLETSRLQKDNERLTLELAMMTNDRNRYGSTIRLHDQVNGLRERWEEVTQEYFDMRQQIGKLINPEHMKNSICGFCGHDA